ncbi:MAG TPA: site-2 protease family protein [Xenococcaceae cyanobacterium]
MQSFRLGSIYGFEISVDLSWFLIFFLILWSLSVSVFPTDFPELSDITYLIMGIVGTLLFFASIITHELAHSLVAKTKGIPVEGITLFVFGGISRTRMDAETPGDEFQIAGVGPLVSLILAGIFALIWWLGRSAGWTVAITGVARYLASINLLLAIFNLLPGFPLDGGRLFRSVIWKATGDLKKATRIASWGGQFFAYVLIALGFVQLFGGNLVGGLWLVLIGWFLANAAEMSYQQHLIRTGLEGVRAKEVMLESPETVPPDLSLQTLVDEYFLHRRYQAFPVTQNGHLVGIISLNQVKEIVREQWQKQTIAETMTPINDTVTVRLETPMTEVLQKMQDSKIQRVLVTRDDQLVGIITGGDVSSWLRRMRELKRT